MYNKKSDMVIKHHIRFFVCVLYSNLSDRNNKGVLPLSDIPLYIT